MRLAAAQTVPQTITVPALGNDMLVRIGRAEVGADPMFAELRADLASRACGVVDPARRTIAWLAEATQQANQISYRFDLREFGGSGEFELIDLSDAPSVERANALAIADQRGTAKIVVIVGVDGEGSATLAVAGVDEELEVRLGSMVMIPAYLCPAFRRSPEPLRVLRTVARGPAFR